MDKYELTNETKEFEGCILHRIRALRDIADMVKAGGLGGWIEKGENLSQFDKAWVFGNARVYGKARVYGDVWVCDNARVHGDARVFGNARVFDNAWVCDNVRVHGNARVCDKARVC
jgi:hypothetical protein